jgi:hypothetical protein
MITNMPARSEPVEGRRARSWFDTLTTSVSWFGEFGASVP